MCALMRQGRDTPIRDAKILDDPSMKRRVRIALFAIALVLLVLFILFAVPVVAGLFAAARQKMLTGFLSSIIAASAFDFWPIATSYAGWEMPALFSSLLAFLIFGALFMFLSSRIDAGAGKDAKNVFGPVASKTNSKGSARTYSNPDLIAEIDEVCSPDDLPPYGSLVIGCLHGNKKSQDRLILAPPESHGLVIGMTGSGKTQIVNLPSIWAMANAKEPCSAVILDPKGELYGATSPYVRERGIRVALVDFRNPELSMCINPLQPIIDAFFAKKEVYDEEMALAAAVANEKGLSISEACEEASWPPAQADAFLAFKTHVKRAEAAKKSGWSKAEALTRDVALTIIRDADELGTSSGVQHWLDVGRGVLEALILFCATYTKEDYIGEDDPYPEPYPEQRTLPSVLSILRKYSGEEKDAAKKARKLVRLFDKIDPEHPAAKAFSPIKSSQDKEIATTLSEALKFLTKLISSDMEAMLNRSDIDFASLGEERTFLYVNVPTDRAAAGRMFVLLFQQMYQILVDMAVAHEGRLPVRVNFLLEEFASVCQGNKVDGLPDMLTMGRSYNMRFYITVQNLSQLSRIYDVHTLNTILDNCGVKVLIKTSDASGTARFFSQAVGKYTFTAKNESQSRTAPLFSGRERTSSVHEEQRAYFTEDELSRWPDEFGALVLQAIPGKDVKHSRLARRLGWNGILYPLIIQTKKAFQIEYVAHAFALDDEEELLRRKEAARSDTQIDSRTPLVAWDPLGRSELERETVRRELYSGGISLTSKRAIAREQRREKVREKAQVLLKRKADAQTIRKGGFAFVTKLTDEIFDACIQEGLSKEGAKREEVYQEAFAIKGALIDLLLEILDGKEDECLLAGL